jgi:integrase
VATRLTDRGISALKPSDASTYFFDTEVAGLALRLYPSGLRSFVFDYRENGKQRRVTIGRFPTWTIGKARTHASRMRLRADAGEIVAPRGERIADLIESWRAVVRLTRRPGTVTGYSLAIDNHIIPAFGKLTPRELSRNAIESWHGELAQATPIQANRSLGVLSSFISWLEHDHRIERNPCRGVRRCTENQRHTFLDADEILAAHRALSGDNIRPAALALRLALLTGCRIGEAIGLTVSQLNFERKLWIKPAATTKQKPRRWRGAGPRFRRSAGCSATARRRPRKDICTWSTPISWRWWNVRKRGRPQLTEPEVRRRALQVHGLMEQELAAMRRSGRPALKKLALTRAALRLNMSERSVRRLLAVAAADYIYVPVVEDWSKTALGAFLRQAKFCSTGTFFGQ